MKIRKDLILTIVILITPSILLAGGSVIRIGQSPSKVQTIESKRTFTKKSKSKAKSEKKKQVDRPSAAQNVPLSKAEIENKKLRELVKALLKQQLLNKKKRIIKKF